MWARVVVNYFKDACKFYAVFLLGFVESGKVKGSAKTVYSRQICFVNYSTVINIDREDWTKNCM
jgi:hypothetical protein